MKKILFALMATLLFATVACGPSAKQIEEKRIADSIRVADSIAMVQSIDTTKAAVADTTKK